MSYLVFKSGLCTVIELAACGGKEFLDLRHVRAVNEFAIIVAFSLSLCRWAVGGPLGGTRKILVQLSMQLCACFGNKAVAMRASSKKKFQDKIE